jgi:Flavin containing amine oxidoreductase
MIPCWLLKSMCMIQDEDERFAVLSLCVFGSIKQETRASALTMIALLLFRSGDGVGFQLEVYDETDGTFEYDSFFETVGDYHLLNYTWFQFFHDYIAPTSAPNVVLSCVVTSIDYSSSSVVTVACADGRTFLADQVIVTVPLTVLQAGSITFNPPLPPAKLDAMDTMPSKSNRPILANAFSTMPR